MRTCCVVCRKQQGFSIAEMEKVNQKRLILFKGQEDENDLVTASYL